MAVLQAWPGLLQEFGQPVFTELHLPARHFGTLVYRDGGFVLK